MGDPLKLSHAITHPELREALDRLARGEAVPPPPLRADEIQFSKDALGRETAALPDGPAHRAKLWPSRLVGLGLPKNISETMTLTPEQQGVADTLYQRRCNAVLFGPSSRGKTLVALQALRNLHLTGVSVLAMTFAHFTRSMKPAALEAEGKTESTVLAVLARPEVLFLDDLGYGDSGYESTEHDRKIFLELLNAREAVAEDGFPAATWVTTNHEKLDDLLIYGSAAISRLRREDRCVEVDFRRMRNFRLAEGRGA